MNQKSTIVIEVVVYNIISAFKAQEGGADRVELCDNPADGGTTPSYGTLAQVRQNLSIDVFAMIRPRGGDFFYSNYEYHAMRHDIEMCKRLGADGVVLGILHPDGTLDRERCKRLVDYARPLKVTCHRAFDMTHDPFETLEACIDVGFDRILTAGQQPKAVDGVGCIAELVSRARGRIIIIPGSGVNESTVGEIVSKTGVREIHVSATRFSESVMAHRNNAISTLGSTEGSEYKIRSVDPDRVRKIRLSAEMKSA